MSQKLRQTLSKKNSSSSSSSSSGSSKSLVHGDSASGTPQQNQFLSDQLQAYKGYVKQLRVLFLFLLSLFIKFYLSSRSLSLLLL